VTLILGTSGWQYADWREPYYRGTPQRRWFEHVLDDFCSVELNVTFYRLPKAEVFAGWRERSPADAILAVKASRYITHVKRLRDPGPSVRLLLERCEPLGDKLGPILIQLPPDLQVDCDDLDGVLTAFPRSMRLAVEPRHPSWWIDGVRRVLERHEAALVWADRKGPITPLWRTAPWCYVRFHEGRARRWPWYGRQALDSWAQRLTALDADDAYVYFNNDPGCAAIDNAVTLGRMLRRLGADVTRVPEHRPTHGPRVGL
jgi:uncharacterized protein YecE (DUF72 family)